MDRDARKAKLAQLRDKKAGKRHRTEDQDVYEEVDEHDYNAVYDDANFVEDDDEGGYIDNGLNNDDGNQYSDEYDDTDSKLASKRKRKTAAGSSKDKKPPPPSSQSIASMFSKSAKMSAVKDRKIKTDEKTKKEDDDFMADILASIDDEKSERKRPSALSSPSKAAVSSSGLPQNLGFSHRPRSSLRYGSGLSSGYMVRGGMAQKTPTPAPAASQQTVSSIKSEFSQGTSSSNNSSGILKGFDNSKSRTGNRVSFFAESDVTSSGDVNMDEEGESSSAVVTSSNGDNNEYFDDDSDLMMAAMDDYEKQNGTSANENDIESLIVPKAEPKPFMKVKEERPDLQTWETAAAMVSDTIPVEESVEDAVRSMEPLRNVDALEKDGSLNMWWYDAFERRDKGYVYLFGKILNKTTNRYISCCVTIKNIERTLFVLPRKNKLDAQGNPTSEEVTITDVHAEFTAMTTANNINKFLAKPVSRKYAFELPDVPRESDYLKVHYSYQQPNLPENISGNSFSHVFGINTGPLEHFLVKRDIMGPCWIKIEDAKLSGSNETWCKAEAIVEDPKLVNPLRDDHGNSPNHIPPLVIMSLSLRTVMNHQKNQNEIVAASGLVCTQVQIDEPIPIEKQSKTRFTIVRQLSNTPYPAGFNDIVARERKAGFALQVERTENALLNCLIAKIHVADPDVIVGHNFAGFDLDVLLHRMKSLNTQHWHKLGRFKRRYWPKLQQGAGGAGEATYQERMFMSGRLICDTYLAAKDLIRSKSYRLTDLAQSQLKIAREDLEYDKTHIFFEDPKTLMHLVKHCAFDTVLTSSLMFKLQILPLTKQLTNLAGNLWSRSMTGARAERNEFLLLHEFHRQKYICPDKQYPKTNVPEQLDPEFDADEIGEQLQKTKSKSGRRKPAYAGGLVLEPKKGFYDKYVLLLDFNSLYPSIMQEYNVCFTTVQRHNITSNEEEEADDKVPDVPDANIDQGLLPRLIKTLVDRRRQVKKLMKDPKNTETELMQFDIRQKALKLTANSMYGCLGFSNSRFYAKPLAMLITHKGREILQNTVDLAGTLDLNVVYGDTDSIMVYTNESEIQKVKEIGNMLKKKVNERYSLLEIDIDGFFKHLLLLKKKKYAALLVEEKPDGTLTETVETKGLDLVRRDWCDLSHDVSSHVLSFILSEKDREEVVEEIHTYLEAIGREIREGSIPLEKFIINKQLTKAPQEYADAKSQPHVQVALRMREAGISVKSGDTIPYVICQVDNVPTGTKAGFADRAFHPDDVVRNEMKLDIDWYLNQQVHPPIGRLCSPIDGTDIARLAECLGLDSTKFNVSRTYVEEEEEFATLESQISDAERFKDAERLVLQCGFCRHEQTFEGITRMLEDNTVVPGLQCSGCQRMIAETTIRGALIRAMRSFIRKYYQGWLVCDDNTCDSRTRSMSVFGRRCLKDNCHGAMKREYTDKQLYTQLLYLTTILDPSKAKQNAAGAPLSASIESIINKNHTMFTRLNAVADGYLQRSGYRHVDLSKLMSLVKI
ncbi:DNA polymerase family B-domain-containing protein [Phascolomyces articulosus]|uniref:DNA polymerase n=1 Tax=Phascolomyces articulosus TaxID=60185 RepID=A0AAD5PBW8_9FUNG|nr:DNA polymerase family B-domain-containing protein [Phascolomyces articulosus]